MLSLLPLNSLVLLFVVLSDALVTAVPRPNAPAGITMNLQRRHPSAKSTEEWGAWAKGNKAGLVSKYGGGSQAQKRSSGTNLMVNQNSDSSFYGSLAIGTPAVSYNVILDTGSADLWVADSSCSTGCGSVPTFDSSASTTFQNTSQDFSITYGSGAAKGVLGRDTVQMAGFSVSQQVFALCDQVTQDLLEDPVSGLLGLGFQTIASSGATPFWQALAEGGAWDSPLMAFQLTRYTDDTQAATLEPGGSFTMGFVNSSFYTGDIEFNSLPDAGSYWLQTISSITVQGSPITLSSSGLSAAIDTGTTLVGGPANYMAAIYAQIPNSAPGTGDFESYYTFPCDTTVSVSMAFGGKSWSISSADFIVAQLNRQTCLGAFFELDTGPSGPAWIVGDTFLKNVYSVFRYQPAAVGFAQLSDYALSLNGADAPVPSATIGSVAAAVSATGTGGSRVENNSALRWGLSKGHLVAICTSLFFILTGRSFI